MRGEIRASLARYLPDYEVPFGGADHDRVAFYARCKLIEDVAYGIGTPGAHRFTRRPACHASRGPSGPCRRMRSHRWPASRRAGKTGLRPERRPGMRELEYFVVCSVDGFIAAEDGSVRGAWPTYLTWRKRQKDTLREAEKELPCRVYRKANDSRGREAYGVANRTGGTVVEAPQDRMIPGARPMHPVVAR